MEVRLLLPPPPLDQQSNSCIPICGAFMIRIAKTTTQDSISYNEIISISISLKSFIDIIKICDAHCTFEFGDIVSTL